MHKFSIVQKLTCAKRYESSAKIVFIFLHLTRHIHLCKKYKIADISVQMK